MIPVFPVVLSVGFILLVFSQILIIATNGKPTIVPDIPRELTLGKGPTITYVVMGDSTAIGQGAEYKDGIAYRSAEFLAKKNQVKLINLGVSGATASKVLRNQAHAAASQKADIILICVGANDVTHLSSLGSVEKDMTDSIAMLQKTNAGAKIILTGSPAMGSVLRFPQPTKFLAKIRTVQVNKVMQKVADEKGVVRLKIAEKTEPIFLKNPQLFASDKFHPNGKGYAVWLSIIIDALMKIN